MIPIKPKNVIWSDEQWQAIYESDKNILVSAGAGSGKTAVLTERIKQKVLKGDSLQNLIVLTFTEDAASMMKERIRKSLLKESYNTNSEHLKKELKHLDEAHIQTFDSFTAFLVKKYHYLLGLPKKVSIIDQSFLDINLRKIIDEVFEELFANQDLKMILLAETFTIRDAESLKELFVSLIKKFELIIDQNNFIENYFETYFTVQYDEFIEKKLLTYYQTKLKEIYDIWENGPQFTDSLIIKHKIECEELLNPYFVLAKKQFTFEDIKKLPDIKFPQIPRSALESDKTLMKVLKETTKKNIKTLLSNDDNYVDFNSYKEEYHSTKSFVNAILEIYQKIDQKVTDYKTKYQVYTFMDIAKFAIKLLQDYSSIREELKNKTSEILIDEYQDTSNVQETLIKLIANNNVYMVGDIKQSIYRFRNANPKIFKEKYYQYQNANNSIVIDLMKNYRSRNEVLDDINLIFEDIMSPNYGGVEYNHGHSLICGNTNYQKCQLYDYHMNVFTYNADIYDSFSKEEIEAYIIGRDIIMKMQDTKILDGDFTRPIQYRDFAILTASTNCFRTYGKIFKYLGIPFVVSSNSSFINSEEILFLKAMLECSYAYIDNNYYEKQFKFSLLSVLRSFVIEATDNDIHEIITSKKKLRDVYPFLEERIYKYAELMQIKPLSDIVEIIIKDFNLYQMLMKIGSVKERTQKIDFFYKKSEELSHLKVSEFLEYLQIQYEGENTDIEFNLEKETEVDAVKLTSIHKSKGLEYPICYITNLYKQFNQQDLNQSFLFNEEYGIITKANSEGLKHTILQKLFRDDYIRADISEKIRLFYVALTRAKEKIIFVMPNLTSVHPKIYDGIKEAYRSLFDIMNSINYKISKYSLEVDLANYNLTKDYLLPKTQKFPQYQESIKEYQKPIIATSRNDYQRPSKNVAKILTAKSLKNMEQGEKFHELLEVTKIIGNDKKQIHPLIENFLNHPFIVQKTFINEYHEYKYFDENNHQGIIDLILETVDCYYIIDYKLKNIDDEAYVKQLTKYHEYLTSITTKPVKTYLYSITEHRFNELTIGN